MAQMRLRTRKILCGLLAVLLTAVPSISPGFEIQNPVLAAYAACLSDAIEHDVSKDGLTIRFTCRGEPARRFFQLLYDLNYETVNETIPRTGTYRTRYVPRPSGRDGPRDQCFQKVEDADGTPRKEPFFGCTIHLVVGEILNR
jgi:hypothetical protein